MSLSELIVELEGKREEAIGNGLNPDDISVWYESDDGPSAEIGDLELTQKMNNDWVLYLRY